MNSFNEVRGMGRTQRAMMDAPANAVYVAPTEHTGYFRRLAINILREDLKIIPISRVEYLIGTHRHIVFDHACPPLTPRQRLTAKGVNLAASRQ